jgi:outer membrane lipoprotein carrier protein
MLMQPVSKHRATRRVRRILSLCAACTCSLLAVRPAAAALDASAIVQKVQQRYDDTHDFTATVTQEMTVASLGKTVTSSGKVAFKKPGRVRWEIDQGDPQIVVADGTTLWLYQPTEHQVLKTPFDAAFRSSTPLSFLSGVGRIKEDFEVSVDAAQPDPASYSLTLVPRHDSGALGRLRLVVDRQTFDIRGADVYDPQGNVSRLMFSHVQRNLGLDDKQFVFEVPPGVDVVNAPVAQ